MASSLLALLDDIATVLDDVAVLTKVATQKTAGVLGDDLALNAQQVAGLSSDRELPVVYAVAKGSLRNKAILVPLALAISGFAPWGVSPLLMAGGAFLCFEGVEKLVHKYLERREGQAHEEKLHQAVRDVSVDLVAFEKEKIKGAIRTDFVLSAEIIAITLGTVVQAGFGVQVAVLVGISLLMTVGVYGLVGGIVKLDNLGAFLARKSSPVARQVGQVLVAGSPWLMKGLTVAGTLAMFLVGGGIITHGIPALHPEGWTHGLGRLAGGLVSGGIDVGVGLAVGSTALALVWGVKKLLPRRARAA